MPLLKKNKEKFSWSSQNLGYRGIRKHSGFKIVTRLYMGYTDMGYLVYFFALIAMLVPVICYLFGWHVSSNNITTLSILLIIFAFSGMYALHRQDAKQNHTQKTKTEAPGLTPAPKESHKETFKAAPALNPEDLKSIEGDKQTKEPIEMPEKPEDGEMDDGVTRYSI